MREGFTYDNERTLGYKITSICPAPAGLFAYYDAGEEASGEAYKTYQAPVICLAVVEMVNEDTGETWQEVRAMVTCDQQDALDFAGEPEDFITVAHE